MGRPSQEQKDQVTCSRRCHSPGPLAQSGVQVYAATSSLGKPTRRRSVYAPNEEESFEEGGECATSPRTIAGPGPDEWDQRSFVVTLDSLSAPTGNAMSQHYTHFGAD